MEDRDKDPVRIFDRRHFTREGDRRKEEDLPPEERPVENRAAPAQDAPPAGPVPQREPEKDAPVDKPGQPSVFTELVLSLSTSCYMSLGRIPNPSAGLSEVDLEAAASYIDILEMLALKTRGNLDPYEQDVLDKILYELKLAYVQVRQKIGP